MKKRRRTKAQNQTAHFKKRCDERLGVQINRKEIQKRIRNHSFDENFYLLGKQSNRVTRYRYKLQDKWYIIPYDRNTHKVITIFEDKIQDITEEKNIDIQQKQAFNLFTWLKKIFHFLHPLSTK